MQAHSGLRFNKRELLAGAGAAAALALMPRISRAAGEVLGAGATTGFGIVNGMMLTPALVFGRMIGERVYA